jgi:hypothetical protein
MRRRRFRGLVQCPICADHAITRLPSAPRLNLSGAAAAGAANGRRAQGPGAAPVTLQSLYMKAVKQVLAQTEDVGERFAEEARRMHYDEAPERGIRGHGVDEVQALAEEASIRWPRGAGCARSRRLLSRPVPRQCLPGA